MEQTPKTKNVAAIKPKKPAAKRSRAKKPSKSSESTPAPLTLQPLAGTRREGESDKAVLACNDYLRLPHRSLGKLHRCYMRQVTEIDQNRPISASAGPGLSSLKQWSAHNEWPERAALYEYVLERERSDIHKLYLRTGIAAPYARVQFLKEVFSVLEDDFSEMDVTGRRHNLWLAEPRAIPVDDGNGNVKMEVFDIYRYNAPLVSHLFQVLDDLAKETNGRRVGDRAEELLKALIMKVGADKLPLNLVNRIAAGEGAYEVLIDAINQLDVSSLPLYPNTANRNGGGG